MQTFLPYSDFERSAKCLDNKRLGKQRVEVLVLLQGGWKYHPCSKMWQPYLDTLVEYGLVICNEWLRRGFQDSCASKIESFYSGEDLCSPTWLGWEDFHASHRSNLLRKDLKYYSKFKWTEPNNLPYIWPKEL